VTELPVRCVPVVECRAGAWISTCMWCRVLTLGWYSFTAVLWDLWWTKCLLGLHWYSVFISVCLWHSWPAVFATDHVAKQ